MRTTRFSRFSYIKENVTLPTAHVHVGIWKPDRRLGSLEKDYRTKFQWFESSWVNSPFRTGLRHKKCSCTQLCSCIYLFCHSVNDANIFSTWAFRTSTFVVFDVLTFLQTVVISIHNCGVVEKHITTIALNESKTFFCQFLNLTLWHYAYSSRR